MDVTSLLNTSVSLPTTKRARSSESPAITHGGHTAPSSVLPTPSPDRVLAPSEGEKGKSSQSPWTTVEYPLHVAVESKFAQAPVFYHSFDRKAESEPSYETHSTQYSRSRHSSVSSRDSSTRSTSQSPKTFSSNQWTKTEEPNKMSKFMGVDDTRAINVPPTGHSPSDIHRPMSPTDAVLQMKGQSRLVADEARVKGFHDKKAPSNTHKRTMSAPDIAQISVARIPHHQRASIPPRAEAIEEGIDEDGEHLVSPDLALAGTDGTEKEAYCMFVKDCDTGSQLRKAISHLFGRNKACTLRIPKHVWVYYCRKHYQRIRYRNAKTYPLNQMELVKLQIIRLQEWSDDNQKHQRGPHIKQWSLSLRKREQSRIENSGTIDGGGALDSRNAAGTAVPEWLIQRVGSGYTTEEVMDVASRLYAEIKDGMLSQVPEVEFLPDIVDAESAGSTKTVRSRRQTRPSNGPRTPKRKAPEPLALCRRSSHIPESHYSDYYNGEETYEVVSPSGKRARVVGCPPPGRRESSQLPPLASALSGAEMHLPPGPPRAANVVPRIQPLEYRRGSVQSDPRRESHDSHPHSAYSVHSSQGGYWYESSYAMGPPPSLPPPISAQSDSRFPRQHEHQYARPPHMRSVSVYAPPERPWAGPGRPSSSGDEVAPYPDRRHEAVPRNVPGYEQGYGYGWQSHHHGSPSQGPPMHGPPGYAPRHAAPQPYSAGLPPGWARENTRVYARDRP